MKPTGYTKNRKRKFAGKLKRIITILLKLPLYVIAIPIVFLIRIIRPWHLLRFEGLVSSRIGHFAANTELYLCERDAGINLPSQSHTDIFYFADRPICNSQLADMWRKKLHIWPAWMVRHIDRANRLLPGGKLHEIGPNTMHDQDVHDLLTQIPPHLEFSPEEVAAGEAALRAMKIPVGARYICLIVRDSAYLAGERWSYHSYRDSDIQNYVLAVEELANRGYFVIRMGARVHAAIKSSNRRVIDYATNGMRSDFLDIYIGANCFFAISTATGWDAVPLIFRRPILYVNLMPVGYHFKFRKVFLAITKRHFLLKENRELSLSEIFSHGVGFSCLSEDYQDRGIKLIENTPGELRDVSIEMLERLNETWHDHEDDKLLQDRFWELFQNDAVNAYPGRPFCGKIRSRYGAAFLRENRAWLR